MTKHVRAITMTLLVDTLANELIQHLPAFKSPVVRKAWPIFLNDAGSAGGKVDKCFVDPWTFVFKLCS